MKTLSPPRHLEKLIQALRKLPGVGNRSAERFAYKILEWSDRDQETFGQLIKDIQNNILVCPDCGALIENDCSLCERNTGADDILCVVATFKDVFSIESTNEFRGRYHILGGLLSPLDHAMPEHLKLGNLRKRVEELNIKELLLALDSTLEGDATALWIKNEMKGLNIQISRPAFGLPMGSQLDYVDGGTLAQALSSRRVF